MSFPCSPTISRSGSMSCGSPAAVEPAVRRRGEIPHRQGRAEEGVHPGDGVADRHGVPCVSVVSGADGHEIGTVGMSGSHLELHGHLHGHLHGYRAAVGVEDMAHRGRNDAQQQLAQLDGRLMGQSSEHHVRHAVQLPAYGLVEHGVIVPVYGTPPGGHALDKLSAVLKGDPAALCAADLVGRQRVYG